MVLTRISDFKLCNPLLIPTGPVEVCYICGDRVARVQMTGRRLWHPASSKQDRAWCVRRDEWWRSRSVMAGFSTGRTVPVPPSRTSPYEWRALVCEPRVHGCHRGVSAVTGRDNRSLDRQTGRGAGRGPHPSCAYAQRKRVVYKLSLRT